MYLDNPITRECGHQTWLDKNLEGEDSVLVGLVTVAIRMPRNIRFFLNMGAECYLATSGSDHLVTQPQERYPQLHRCEKLITLNFEQYCHGQFENSVPALVWRDKKT